MLPWGYIAMFPLVFARNALFRRQVTDEMKRRRLGPFGPGGAAEGSGA